MADNPTPIKKVDPTVKWGALFVIALMLLSAVAVYFGSQSVDNTTNPPNPNAQSEGISVFTADDIQGTVTDVFQSAVVGGTTPLSDKTILDEALNQVAGVQSLTSQFINLNSADNTLTYKADVTLNEGVNHEAFMQDVQALNLFTAPEVYFQAAVQVPSAIDAVDSANNPQSITLPNPQIQGFVTGSTLKGDKISGNLQAGFQGVQYVNAYLIETQNLSASPTPLVFSEQYTLTHLEPVLTLAGSVNYYPALSAESLQTGIAGVQGVTGVNTPIIPQLNNTLIITLDEADAAAGDVNALVLAHPDQFTDVQLVESGLRVGLKNITLTEAKSLLTETIQQALLTTAPIDFTDPVTQFLVDVNADSLNTQPITEKLKVYFTNLNANANVDVYQKGSTDLNALVLPDTNEAFPLANGVLPVSVFPGHAVGDVISFDVTAIAVRDKLEYVNAAEAAPADSNSEI